MQCLMIECYLQMYQFPLYQYLPDKPLSFPLLIQLPVCQLPWLKGITKDWLCSKQLGERYSRLGILQSPYQINYMYQFTLFVCVQHKIECVQLLHQQFFVCVWRSFKYNISIFLGGAVLILIFCLFFPFRLIFYLSNGGDQISNMYHFTHVRVVGRGGGVSRKKCW